MSLLVYTFAEGGAEPLQATKEKHFNCICSLFVNCVRNHENLGDETPLCCEVGVIGGAEMQQLLPELLCPWLLGFQPATATQQNIVPHSG